jgi:uncharacterized membrane protein YeaQ/YmgE (transglycosylase-associated protein family)
VNIIAWIILGLLSGAIAKAIVPGYQGGNWLTTMVLGIIGAFIGGTLHSLIWSEIPQITSSDLSIPGVFLAVLGSIIAIFLYGALSRRRG